MNRRNLFSTLIGGLGVSTLLPKLSIGKTINVRRPTRFKTKGGDQYTPTGVKWGEADFLYSTEELKLDV